MDYKRETFKKKNNISAYKYIYETSARVLMRMY